MRVEFINPFIESTLRSLELMAGISATRENLTLKEGLITTFDISSIVSLTGQVEGSIIISMPSSLACKVASNLLMEEHTELDPAVEDAIGEMGNIIVGDARRSLKDSGYDVSISLPNVVFGTGHHISRRPSVPCIAIPFTTPEGPFEVNVGIKEASS
ncbi:MAG: chemotaxis protein CheX [Acidobacteria bacterium]|nr:chemotaxis protein CheX [Acidobacteriota bacterium]MCB9396361.1 chemotaxis protein CheX [Acidobacteriota bacterium]